MFIQENVDLSKFETIDDLCKYFCYRNGDLYLPWCCKSWVELFNQHFIITVNVK